MKRTATTRILTLAVSWALTLPSALFAAGDRGIDVDQRYPDDTLVQNGGPIYDVTRPPQGSRAAKGDGVTDDTEALRDAFDFLKKRHQEGFMTGAGNLHLYLPNGTYLVSGPVFYRGDVALDRGNRPNAENQDRRHDILRVRIIGQSRAKTVLRLADKAPEFNDPAKPQVLLSYQHPKTTFNKGPGHNILRNLTINTGSGNPGAIGVRFQGARRTDLRNVTILSGDGAGVCGLWMPSGPMQGCSIDFSIGGFDYGIHVTKLNEAPEISPGFEHCTLVGQKKAAIRIDNGGTSIRRLRSDQTQTGATALEIAGDGVQVVLIESALAGKKGIPSAIVLTQKDQQCVFVRDVVLGGYTVAIQQPERQPVPGPQIAEYLNYAPIIINTGAPPRSMRLEVKETPIVPVFPPQQWANVNSFGAKGDGETDDFEAIQKAFLSGKPVVYFPSATYKTGDRIRVPAGVQRIELLGTTFRYEHPHNRGFSIGENSQQPILITDSDGHISTWLHTSRTVVYRNMTGSLWTGARAPVETFIENCSQLGNHQSFCISVQKIWGRGLNNDSGAGSCFISNGGTLWVFNFKTEHHECPAFEVKQGSRVEVLGGCANAAQSGIGFSPMIVLRDAEASITMFTDHSAAFGNITEERKGKLQTLRHKELPRRMTAQPNLVFVPLYISGKP
ncbi:MAG: hypothetical protein FJ395_07595 [Verrucomicrobia bacterium]|nr:hypothetical protein [Verrucomicrobiota bacterium]